jgi:hypothetical protein
MSREDGNCQSQEMPTQLEQVVSSFLFHGLPMTWQISPSPSALKNVTIWPEIVFVFLCKY